MTPLPPDPHEPIERRPMRRRTDVCASSADPEGADSASLLSRLVDLVTARARDVAGAHAVDPEPMERLRESVEALGSVLDAIRLVGGAEALRVGRAREAPPPRVAAPTVQPPTGWGAPANTPDRPEGPGETPTGGELAPDEPPPAFAPFRDSLTGLHSRAGFDELAAGELGRSLRHDRAFSVARIRLGRPGTDVLRDAAGCLRRGLRGSDLVAHDGNREFLLAFAETGREDANAIVRRLVAGLRGDGGDVAGAWVGSATCPSDGNSLDALLEVARSRMAGPPTPSAPDASRRS